MKRATVKILIPEDLKLVFYARIRKRDRSRFIADAIRKALEEDATLKEQELDAAYDAANRDEDRLEILQEWNEQDDVTDLINENEDWDWLRQSTPCSKKSNP